MPSFKLTMKAEAFALALEKILGVEPSIKYSGKRAKLYYKKSRVPKAQKGFSKLIKKPDKPAEITVDLNNVIAPILIKKYGVFVGGIVAALLFIKIR